MQNTKYKAIQPQCGMELQKSKRLALATQSQSFKTMAILITTYTKKTFLGKKLF